MQHRHPQPARGFSYLGFHRYFLTFCTHYRAPLFTSAAVVDLGLAQISRAASETGMAVIAYCFMPDHLHLLVRGESEASDLRDFIKRAKQYSGFYYSKTSGRKLWQRYGHDHVLRDDEKTEDVVRYILLNPVRAGLCERAADYPFASATISGADRL
jgi:putative transposase